jgi:hypothetical protein
VFSERKRPVGSGVIVDQDSTTPTPASINQALAELRSAIEEKRRVDPEAFALTAASVCGESPELDGAVFLLRGTVTTELLTVLDWQVLAQGCSRDGVTLYGTPERARADFTDAATRNDAMLPTKLNEAEQQRVRVETDAMLASAGIRRLRRVETDDGWYWRRLVRRAVGLPRSRVATHRPGRRGRGPAGRSAGSRRTTARAPDRPHPAAGADHDPDLEPVLGRHGRCS